MPENDIMTENCFFDEFVQTTRKYFVATNNNYAIGYIGVFDSFDDYNIIGIAVEKGYQRQGIGYKLLQSIIEEANTDLVGV
jgi:GNAT superfamily N-acetyltransferase